MGLHVLLDLELIEGVLKVGIHIAEYFIHFADVLHFAVPVQKILLEETI